MQNHAFINREKELSVLHERFKTSRAELIVVYGRRRVGKTTILKEFLKRVGGVYFLGRQESELDQLRRFSSILARYFGDKFLEKSPFTNWDGLFEYLASKAENQRVVVIFDEFPYMVSSCPKLPSILQDFWDNRLSYTKIFIVLCGSSIGMMEEIIGGKSPLYGRRTGQLRIGPLKFSDVRKFFPKYTFRDQITVYAVLGGTPAYLVQFDTQKNIMSNIEENVLRTDAFLYQDPLFVLREEIEEPRFYFSILKAIAYGATRLSDIINLTGLGKGLVSKYIATLIDLDLIKREVPVTEKHPEKSRKGIYKIKDHFFRFWFRFIYPHMEEIELGDTKFIIDTIERNLQEFVAPVFEEICMEALKILNLKNKLPTRFLQFGKWWNRGEEIDIVALDPRTKCMLVAECKWSTKPVSASELGRLVEKAELVEWMNDTRKTFYAYFSSGGFTKSAYSVAQEYNIFTFDLEKLEKIFSNKV
ncbi:MAG: ATP-binding protein [Candidatus Baldrarchaeia archaeon]